jgi:hypothetical protein
MVNVTSRQSCLALLATEILKITVSHESLTERERPHPPATRRDRVDPRAQQPIVDLCLLTGRHRVTQHDHLVAPHLLSQVRRYPPLQRRQARPQPVFTTQPLVDPRLPHPPP